MLAIDNILHCMVSNVIQKASVPKSYSLSDIRLVKNCLLQMLQFFSKNWSTNYPQDFFLTLRKLTRKIFRSQEKNFSTYEGPAIFLSTHNGTTVRDAEWH